jgi:preprotein translocase subunit YajC
MASLFPLLVLLALFAFTFSQNRKRQRNAAALVAALAPGVTVMTAGGIYGTVRSIADDIVVLEISPGVTIRMAKAAIGRVVDSPIVDAVDAPAMLPGATDDGSHTNDEDRA